MVPYEMCWAVELLKLIEAFTGERARHFTQLFGGETAPNQFMLGPVSLEYLNGEIAPKIV
jgi:hypothetical protein